MNIYAVPQTGNIYIGLSASREESALRTAAEELVAGTDMCVSVWSSRVAYDNVDRLKAKVTFDGKRYSLDTLPGDYASWGSHIATMCKMLRDLRPAIDADVANRARLSGYAEDARKSAIRTSVSVPFRRADDAIEADS